MSARASKVPSGTRTLGRTFGRQGTKKTVIRGIPTSKISPQAPAKTLARHSIADDLGVRDNKNMAKSINLIYAVIWLALGMGLLTLAWTDARYREWPGWAAVGMAAYNLLRWWTTRARRARPGDDPSAVRRRPSIEEPADSPFQLIDEPPPVRLPPRTPGESTQPPPPATGS